MSQKIRIKVGEYEIELEGATAFINNNLKTFWDKIGSPKARGHQAKGKSIRKKK